MRQLVIDKVLYSGRLGEANADSTVVFCNVATVNTNVSGIFHIVHGASGVEVVLKFRVFSFSNHCAIIFWCRNHDIFCNVVTDKTLRTFTHDAAEKFIIHARGSQRGGTGITRYRTDILTHDAAESTIIARAR